MKTSRLLAKTLLAASLASFLQLAPKDSLACSAGPCFSGFFAPKGGDMPASLPGVVWYPRRGGAISPGPTDVGLFEVTAIGTNQVAANVLPYGDAGAFVLTPIAPLSPNTDYILRGKDGCVDGAPPTEATFHTWDAAPLPTTLGTILAAGGSYTTLDVATTSGSCSTNINVQAEPISLTLTAEAAPFVNAFLYETLVDGEPFRATKSLIQEVQPGESWQGRGKDLLYTRCDAPQPPDIGDGLAPGNHTVIFRATLPGSTVVLESEPANIYLECPPIDYVNDPSGSASESGGCNTSQGGRTNGFWAAISVLLLALAVRRKKINRP